MGPDISVTAPAHCHVPRVIEREGIAAIDAHAIACCLAAMQMSSGDFYDIGANVGVYSLMVASALKRRCIAFEPTPVLADVIENSAATHYLPVDVRRVALAAKAGQQTFYLSARSDASNSLAPDFRSHSGELSVEVGTLDTFASSKVGVIKIDTETTEPDVFRGAIRTISDQRPFIVVEVLPSGGTAEFMNEFLARSGYWAYYINSDLHWRPRRDVSIKRAKTERNWLFAPALVSEMFWTYLAAWRWRLLRA